MISGSRSPDVAPLDRLLLAAEVDQERLAAWLRLIVFGALLAMVLTLPRGLGHFRPALVTALAYGGVAGIGLWAAWRHYYRRYLPVVFVTLEIAIVVLQAVLLAAAMAIPASAVMIMPVSALVFVVLAHAAIRYRPWLVLYAAGLFIVAMIAAQRGYTPAPAASGGAMLAHMGAMHDMVHYEAFPVVTLLLTATILFANGRRTRRLLRDAAEARMQAARLSRFFAPEIADRLALQLDSPLSGGQIRQVAVLFADIRGFTRLTETAAPEEIGRLLGEFRKIVAVPVRAHRGVVDKFIGDAVMAVFGYPGPERDAAADALACALAIRDRLAEWSAERHRAGKTAIEVGIGAHFGEAFVGIIGREGLLEFTVIGDTVNVAERLERQTRILDASIAVSRQFHEAAAAPGAERDWSLALRQPVRGRHDLLDVYYLPRPDAAAPGRSEAQLFGQPDC